MNKNSKKRFIAAGITAALLVAAAIGAWLFIQYRNSKKTVDVLPVSQVMDFYWGDQSSSSGVIISDYVQEIYSSSDKTVSEIYVSEGDVVRIGDPLLQYDKTRLELDLETKELAVKQADYNISTAQKQLKKLQNTKPAATAAPTARPTATPKPTATPRPTATPTPTPTPVPPADVTLYSRLDLTSVPYEGSGTTDDPYVFLCTDGCIITPEFMTWLFGGGNAEPTPGPTQAPDDTSSIIEDEDGGEADFPDEDAPATPTPSPTPTPTPAPGSHLRSPFAAVFEVRSGNSNYGQLISSFKLDGTQLSANIENSQILNGYNTIDSIAEVFGATPKPSGSDNYNDMGYTSAQLKQMITEKKQEIKDLQLAKKQAQLDFEKAKLQVSNATVISTVEGTVRSLLDEATAIAEGKPFLVVSGASEYYVAGAVSESMLGSVNIGDEVTVNDYYTGAMYSAQIVSISDYPLDSDSGLYYYGSDNPNSSRYEFTAVVPDAYDMQNGQYVDITLNVQTAAEDALYIQNAYIREDAAGCYVMKADRNNRLVKQYVQTGRSLYGSSTEIKTGLTQEDYIAFPYGNDVKEGVRVVLEDSKEPPYNINDNLSGVTVGGNEQSSYAEDFTDGDSTEQDGEADIYNDYTAEPAVIGGADYD